MTPSQAPWRALAAVSLVSALTLTACASTTMKSTDSAQPRATASPASPSRSSATGSPTDSSTASSGRVQLVKITKYDIAFDLPKGWMTMDAHQVLEGGGNQKNPYLDELAKRLGTSKQRLMQQFSTVVQTMSVSDQGAVDGVLDNVNSIGTDGHLNDEQLKLQLATVGAKLRALTHASTDAGDVTEISYVLHTTSGNHLTIHGVTLAVPTGGSTVLIAVTSSADARAERIAALVLRSLKPIPGSGPNL